MVAMRNMRSHKINGIDIFSLKHIILISIFSACLIFFRSHAIANNTNVNSMNLTNHQNNSILFPTDLGDISFSVYIYDIDTMRARIRIGASLNSYLINASSINITLLGGSKIFANIELINVFGSWYSGASQEIEWEMLGTGDSYPFDTYELEFIIGPDFLYKIDNESKVIWRSINEPKGSDKAFFNISVEGETAKILFYDEQNYREWKIYSDEIPVSHYLKEGFIFEIKRKSLIPFLEFILPIELCYYLLGISMFIDRRKPADRLRVYVSLFIFSSTFIFSIREFLPPRNILSLPELLLINLITSSGIIAIFSLIPVKSDRHGKLLDNISLLISSIIFFSIYYLAYRDIIGKTYSIFLTSLTGLYFSKIVNRIFNAATLIRARSKR